jgi:integrase
MGNLNALGVKNAKPGRHGDGEGLYLLVSATGAKSWMIRVQRDGIRRDIGLGSLASLSLADARTKAAELRKHALNGRDPIEERDRDRRPVPTFREAVKATHEALRAGWSTKTAADFLASLQTYANPAIGNLKVDTIEASHIRDLLAPIWTKVPETSRKVKVRISSVLNFAHSKGWRPTEAPRKSVTVGLSKQAKGGSYAAMPYAEVPAFVQQVREKAFSTGRDALLFQILTAARTGEVRSAKWAHINLKTGEWNRPADLMKNREPHTVTLNPSAVALLTRRRSSSTNPDSFVFSSTKGAMISDMTLSKVMKDADQPFTPHGFRSSFRDWAAEKMHHIPDAVAEAALAHVVPDRVVRAYKRTTFMVLRRALLEEWGKFVHGQTKIEPALK